jgi:hypothetical protein
MSRRRASVAVSGRMLFMAAAALSADTLHATAADRVSGLDSTSQGNQPQHPSPTAGVLRCQPSALLTSSSLSGEGYANSSTTVTYSTTASPVVGSSGPILTDHAFSVGYMGSA